MQPASSLPLEKKKRELNISAARKLQPEVIHDTMIRKYIELFNYESKIFDQDNMPVTALTHLSLSFKNILEIKNLNGLVHLEKLQLDNNIIEKIEGLQILVNLKWLDLSFNNITKIEGLDTLVNLTDLSLYQNKIQKLENMDKLVNLNYFSIGYNDITAQDQVLYLRKFKNLQVLILQGNPFYKNDAESDIKYFIISSFPQLKYLDYMMIDEETVKNALSKHNNMVLYKESNELLATTSEVSKESILKELQEANISRIDNFIEYLKDPDMKKLEVLPKQVELWNRFEEDTKEELSNFQDSMKKDAKLRQEMKDLCEKMMAEEEKEAEKKGIEEIDKFRKLKKNVFRDHIGGKIPLSAVSDLMKSVGFLDKELMRIEMEHYELVGTQIQLKFSQSLDAITQRMNSIRL